MAGCGDSQKAASEKASSRKTAGEKATRRTTLKRRRSLFQARERDVWFSDGLARVSC
jgi:hypothetical protein